MGEWTNGLPRGWTSEKPLSSEVLDLIKKNEPDVIDLRSPGFAAFAGIGALDYGLKEIFDTKVYIEKYEGAQKVLEARQRDGVIPTGPIFSDIQQVQGRMLPKGLKSAKGGWPCTNVSIAGDESGFDDDGKPSTLFFQMTRIVVARLITISPPVPNHFLI